MTTSCLQEKIDKLQNTVHALLHKSNYMAGVNVDDLARLNNEIHEQINDLYPCHGKTAEQEAALCLSLLMGYSVSMYANSEDEAKKETVLTQMSKFWFDLTEDILPNHMISVDVKDMPEFFQQEKFDGNSMMCRKLDMLPIECIVRGYNTGRG